MHIDTKQLKKFGDNLIKIQKTSFPKIINNVMNTAVYEISSKLKKETIPKKFVKRNNFAPMSIRYNRAIGYNLNTMFSMVGQIANAGANNTKTMLEENELGKPIQSRTKHTLLGLKSIRTGNTFSKTIKKENRLANLKPIPVQHILRNFRYINSNNTIENTGSTNQTLELSRISGLIAGNRIKTLNKPIIARTKNNKLGIYRVEKINKESKTDNKVKITKLYSLNNKTTNIKRTAWLKDTYEKEIKNIDKIYTKTAKNILDRNARAFNIQIRSK